MAIKKLQNNYTTPEQSKRLLELGVPADSADLCWRFYTNLYEDAVMWDTPSVIAENQHIEWSHKLRSGYTAYIPCWSVGRLIEIITICCNHYSGNNDIIFNQAAVNHGIIECLVAYLTIEKKDVSVDFSKLEE